MLRKQRKINLKLNIMWGVIYILVVSFFVTNIIAYLLERDKYDFGNIYDSRVLFWLFSKSRKNRDKNSN